MAEKAARKHPTTMQEAEHEVALRLASADLLTLSSFIMWHRKSDMWGGYTADAAFHALCRLLRIDKTGLKKIVGSTEWGLDSE